MRSTTLQPKAIVQALLSALLSFLLWKALHKPLLATLVALLTAVILISSLWFPQLYQRIDGFGQKLGEVVGTALTWAVLAPFFYIVCGLARLYLLLRRVDPLERAFPTNQASYWKPYQPPQSLGSFKRQF